MKTEKFSTLTHQGPLFPKPYQAFGAVILVKGQTLKLDAKQEEMAWAWAAKLETPYVQDKVFQKNFWSDFKKLFPVEVQGSKFPEDWDFTKLNAEILSIREKNKQKTKAQKDAEKADREALRAIYGKAVLNDQEVDLGNYIVEPAGIFMGRGKHPKRGLWKVQATPEDVIINTTDLTKVPKAPEGHSWKAVVTNKCALWASCWYENVTSVQKRIMFAPTSFIKQDSDKRKFAKAVELSKNLDKVLKYIDDGLTSKTKFTREVATVCKLIATMSIRVGDEKDASEQADTRGASTLSLEHIKINGKYLYEIKDVKELM